MNHDTDQDKALRRAEQALLIASGTQANVNPTFSMQNANAIGAALSITSLAAGDLTAIVRPLSGKVRISGGVYVQTDAANVQGVSFQYIRDPYGAAVVIGPVFKGDSGAGKNLSMTLPDFIDAPAAGAVLKYAIVVTAPAGHTVAVLAGGESLMTVNGSSA